MTAIEGASKVAHAKNSSTESTSFPWRYFYFIIFLFFAKVFGNALLLVEII